MDDEQASSVTPPLLLLIAEAVAQSRPTALEREGHLACGILRPSNERLKQITGRETALGEAGGDCLCDSLTRNRHSRLSSGHGRGEGK